jgi:hypothetical protein
VESESNHQTRVVKSYGGGATNEDPYYNENLVLGDLPAGIYKVSFRADEKIQQTWVTINPGQVTYFSYKGVRGFNLNPPPTPTVVLPSTTSTPSR